MFRYTVVSADVSVRSESVQVASKYNFVSIPPIAIKSSAHVVEYLAHVRCTA